MFCFLSYPIGISIVAFYHSFIYILLSFYIYIYIYFYFHIYHCFDSLFYVYFYPHFMLILI